VKKRGKKTRRKKRRIINAKRSRSARSKKRSASVRAAAKKLSSPEIRQLGSFHYLDRAFLGKRLKTLQKLPNALVVLGAGSKNAPEFYLSTLRLIREKLEDAGKGSVSREGAQKDKSKSAAGDIAIRNTIKMAGVRIASVGVSEVPKFLGTRTAAKLTTGFVIQSKNRAVDLVLSSQKAIRSNLPTDVKVLIRSMAERRTPADSERKSASTADKKPLYLEKLFRQQNYSFFRAPIGDVVGVFSEGSTKSRSSRVVRGSITEQESGPGDGTMAADSLSGQLTSPTASSPIDRKGQRAEPPLRSDYEGGTASGDTGDSGPIDGSADFSGSGVADEDSPDSEYRGSPPGDSGGSTQPNLPVYAEIWVSNEHAVQGSLFNVEVSLNFKTSTTVSTPIDAPHDTKEHIFDVHLILGSFSAWGKLAFQRPTGTIQKAIFKDVKAPTLTGNEEEIDGHPVADIQVNFYLDNRWCGEAQKRIEILPGEGTGKLAVVVTPEAPPWRRDLCVTPGTKPPDLLIRITKIGPFDYEWSLFSPFMVFPKGDNKGPNKMTMTLELSPYNFVKKKFEVFVAAQLTDLQIEDLLATCQVIFETAPEGFRRAYRRLAAVAAQDAKISFNTIQIVSDEPFIPWELMRVWDTATPPAFRAELLCVRHSVGRWIASDSAQLGNRLVVEKIAVSASDYKGNPFHLAELPWALIERTFLVGLPYQAQVVPLQLAKLTDFLHSGSAELVHFSCHGSMDVQVPDEATLNVEDDEKGLRAAWVSADETRNGLGVHRPLVFLNACQAAGAGNFLGMVFGWPQAFLRMGATACVAPLWKVVDERAKDIAESFYQAVLVQKSAGQPVQLGEALRQLRSQWRTKKSLTHLGYVLYGDPTTVLSWK
jgi:hypothetical protein